MRLCSVPPAETNAVAFLINLNQANTEYLLIENRQALLYDIEMPAGDDRKTGGLLVLHVDEAMV